MSTTPPPPPSAGDAGGQDGSASSPPGQGAEPAPPVDAAGPPPPPSAGGLGGAAASVPPPPSVGTEGEADHTGHAGEPPPDAPVVTAEVDLGGGDAALLHATELTRTYPCRSCGGELVFDPGSQGLACPHCGNRQEIDLAGVTVPEEQDLHAAVAALRSGALERVQHVSTDEHEVVCQNCGGHTTFTGSLTATRCPYCTTPIQRDDVHDAPARLPVDGVLPFRVPERRANDLIRDWIDSRWFAPNAFKEYSRSGSFASVYAAYFSYDARTRSWYRGRRGDNYTVTVGSGENQRTETRIRWRNVSGQVHNDFDDVTVLANEGLTRKYVDALEPWPTHEVQGWTPQFVAGHLCRTYDHDVEDCFGTAKQRMDAAIEQSIRRDIGGDHQRITSVDTDYDGLTYKHLLLPIWLLTVLFSGAAYQVFINGVTGEVQGERPYSPIKIALAVIAALIVAVTVYALFGRGG